MLDCCHGFSSTCFVLTTRSNTLNYQGQHRICINKSTTSKMSHRPKCLNSKSDRPKMVKIKLLDSWSRTVFIPFEQKSEWRDYNQITDVTKLIFYKILYWNVLSKFSLPKTPAFICLVNLYIWFYTCMYLSLVWRLFQSVEPKKRWYLFQHSLFIMPRVANHNRQNIFFSESPWSWCDSTLSSSPPSCKF